MIGSLLLFVMGCARPSPHESASIQDLDAMAQSRNFDGISRLVDNFPTSSPSPLTVLSTNGAYECGRFGWRAFEMDSPNGHDRYVVLSTPLTTEDIGDFLFLRVGSLLHYVPEDQSMGIHVVKHDMDVSFNIPGKKAEIRDDLTIQPSGSGDFVFRFTNEFRVSKIERMDGTSVRFSQGGGVVLLQKPSTKTETLRIYYAGVLNHPQYSGSITAKEATLTNCYWYPMVARQPAPYEVSVHYPNEWQAIGQGVQVESHSGFAKYKMDLPCIFYSLSAGPYRTGTFKKGDRTFFAWSPRDSDEVLKAQAESYAETIGFYSRFAAFPFKSYGGLDSPQYGGGALEAYSYATYGGGFPYVDAHEPSHTWWGGILNNSYLHSFWNESFAVYSDGLFHREWSGSQAAREAFTPQGETNPGYDKVSCVDSGADKGPIGSDLGYGKGSHVLFMLEKLIGLDSMVRSMHRFVADQRLETTAEWSDFEKAAIAENPSMNLGAFFADWLHRPGHLEMSASVSYDSGKVKIAYRPIGEAYRVPLEVLVGYSDGKTETKIFDVRDVADLEFPTTSKPDYVSIDPYRYLLRVVKPDEHPPEFRAIAQEFPTYIDPAHKSWGSKGNSTVTTVPSDLKGVKLIGSPKTVPAMVDLCKQVGFEVQGSTLTYQGKSVDLEHGGAEALVDLGGDRYCAIELGKTRIRPDIGSARVAVYDDLGRMIAGATSPKTTGTLTFRL